MENFFGTRMLSGKTNATGYLRQNGDGLMLHAAGLPPEKTCRLFCDGALLGEKTADSAGKLSFTPNKDGFFFLCNEKNDPLLWEAGDAGFFRARKLVPKEKAAPSEKAPPAKTAPPSAARVSRPPLQGHPGPAETAEEAPSPQERSVSPSFTVKHSPHPPLPGLPALQWPSAIRSLQPLTESGLPFLPFALPGFRCVKIPGPHAALPFYVIGRKTENSRVTAVLYAVPGGAMRPPASLPGYRYRDGFWYHIQTLA